jgi:Periplasmic copper-binding protein (NosD)
MNLLPRFLTCLALVTINADGASAPDAQSEGVTVHVASNGVDAFPCGGSLSSCRSISFGIANANPGDAIVVAPGRYGDLDGDGSLGGVGEETGEVGFGCQCMVRVNKAVRIFSTHGAGVTVLDASGLLAPTITVFITANSAQLGRADHGFLLKAPSNYTAVYVFAATGVTVAGNLATGGANGFTTDGGSRNIFEHNIAYGNTVGFELGGTHQFVRLNYASGNVLGFIVYGTQTTLRHNIASANDDSGFVIAGSPGVVLTRNLSTGNRFAGFRVESGATPAIFQNNIHGNFCGIFNRSGRTIDATRNYWGAPSGPGADPADNVCNDEGDDVTVTSPVSRRPISVPRMISGKYE